MASEQQVKVSSDEKQNVQLMTIATFGNKGAANINMDRFINWSGTGIFPPTLPANAFCKLTHQPGRNGSMAAVQYSGPTNTGVQYAMIVAFDAPINYSPNVSPNRVFVVRGSKNVIDHMTWDQVLKNLEKASSSSPPYAKITHQPGSANLDAIFE